MHPISFLPLVLFALSWSEHAASEDLHEKCQQWASSGECEANPSYMLEHCARSCDLDKEALDAAPLEDKHEKCATWASTGECDTNPNYMLRHCRKSCQASLHSLTPSLPTDFYSITERDIYGNLVYYSQFRNKLVYVVNVASQCGYTAENYKLLQSLSELRSDATSSGNGMFEILVFPCNQFGAQEPGTADEIAYFAQQFGFDGRVMAKGDVNGRSAGATFQYLKSVTGRQKIAWNFDGKFLVNSDGSVETLTTDTVLDTVTKKLRALASERVKKQGASVAADL